MNERDLSLRNLVGAVLQLCFRSMGFVCHCCHLFVLLGATYWYHNNTAQLGFHAPALLLRIRPCHAVCRAAEKALISPNKRSLEPDHANISRASVSHHRRQRYPCRLMSVMQSSTGWRRSQLHTRTPVQERNVCLDGRERLITSIPYTPTHILFLN